MRTDSTSRNLPDLTDMPIGGQPIHPILVSFSVAYFAGAFVTDFVYWQTAEVT